MHRASQMNAVTKIPGRTGNDRGLVVRGDRNYSHLIQAERWARVTVISTRDLCQVDLTPIGAITAARNLPSHLKSSAAPSSSTIVHTYWPAGAIEESTGRGPPTQLGALAVGLNSNRQRARFFIAVQAGALLVSQPPTPGAEPKPVILVNVLVLARSQRHSIVPFGHDP
jgi:hypothetical protein